ncbi:ATP-binding cassette domain-containing protein [Kineococcus rhizosphaerae]|uniref:ATP-binding cassette domain-containing protein n=1 Tax=Kineococcus rhizosphaerae TaxID=559628 RepID=UPI000D0694F5|nr:ATP-binding cassette domain-containing protein [Kineococcus rhizosphaerae]
MTTPTAARTDTRPVLQLDGVSKRYGAVQALSDVHLTVRPGRVHALLGENGAGKSTLMGVATGVTQPDTGAILVQGEDVGVLTPDAAGRRGIAIVHQHPAVLPDLTVAENLRAGLPAGGRGRDLRGVLDRVGAALDLEDRVDDLSVAQKHVLEIAKAVALEPAVLILDEPTAPLGGDQVDDLFDQVRRAVERGTAVVYITHRLAEVREIAHEVTVLRDGRVTGHAEVADLTDDQMLRMIIGRELTSTFPDKLTTSADAPVVLQVRGLSGAGFHDVDLQARRGEIVGLAGIVGNGQSEFLRALGGLSSTTAGTVELDGAALKGRSLVERTAYMPADRHREGVMPNLSVRENAAVASLRSLARRGFVDARRENSVVGTESAKLALKTASLESGIMSLSGGNQQKVVMTRALLSSPKILLSDEPTQGVDVGARSEIYTLMRAVAAEGVPVVVVSSDAKELEGLCDRVVVVSRGRVVAELTGGDVTEEAITGAVVGADHRVAHGGDAAQVTTGTGRSRTTAAGRWSHFLRGDYAPAVILAAVVVGFGAYVFSQNSRYLAAFNISSVLILLTALAFISLGQGIVIMTGGIDLSLGPLAGLLVVIASFFVNDNKPYALVYLAFGIMLAVAVASGVVNGVLVRYGGFTPVAASLTLYIALQGVSLLLRPFQGGFISAAVSDALTTTVGPVPVAFLVVVVVALGLEFGLRRSNWGRSLRAVGSSEESARRLGVKVNRVHVLAYVGAAVMTFCGALLLMAQIGVGDPTQGVTYTLTSITAVVLGGASLLGGRGSFIGTLLGAVLLQQILNATTFLNLSQTYQYVFQGVLILVAAAIYTRARSTRRVVA